MVKKLPAMQKQQETWVQSLGQGDLLEKDMSTHSSFFFFFAWIISWTEAWWATVYRVSKNYTQLKQLGMLAYVISHLLWLGSPWQHHYWTDCLFSIVYSYLFCLRLDDHRCIRLSLNFVPCSIDLYLCFYTSTKLLSEFSFIIESEVREPDPSFPFFFLKIALVIHGFLCFHITVSFLFNFCEKCHWQFDRDCIESVNFLGWYNHFDDTHSSNSRT